MGFLLLVFFYVDGLCQVRGCFFVGFLWLGYVVGFDVNEGFVVIVWYIVYVDGQCWVWVSGYYIVLMMMYYVDSVVQCVVMDYVVVVGVEIDVIGVVREGLYVVVQNVFFGIVYFIDIVFVKIVYFYCCDIVDVEIVVQGRGGFEFIVGFQFDFIGFVQFKVGIEGEFVWLEFYGFSVVLECKG